MERARAGDRAAFDRIIERYQRRIFSLAYHMLADRDEAADVAQDCFVRAYRAIGRTRGELRLEAVALPHRRQPLPRPAPAPPASALAVRWDGARHDHLLPAGPAATTRRGRPSAPRSGPRRRRRRGASSRA